MIRARALLLLLAAAGCAPDQPAPQPVARDTAAPRPAPVVAVAATAAVEPRVEESRIFPNQCETENCKTAFVAEVCEAVQLRANETDTARVVGELDWGDTVKVTTRNLHLLEAGRVAIRRPFALGTDDMNDDRTPRKDTLHFAAGDTVYLLAYLELGHWIWRYHGKEGDGGNFWTYPSASARAKDTAAAILLSEPRSADWWRVRLPSGVVGWWRADSTGILPVAGEDKCPDPET